MPAALNRSDIAAAIKKKPRSMAPDSHAVALVKKTAAPHSNKEPSVP